MLRQREAMIEQQLVPRGIHDQRVLDAMAQVARERFMPESSRGLAYYDGPVPLGHGQTISQPYIVALMLQLLELEPTHRVLEIGAGMGYKGKPIGSYACHVCHDVIDGRMKTDFDRDFLWQAELEGAIATMGILFDKGILRIA